MVVLQFLRIYRHRLLMHLSIGADVAALFW